MKRRRFFIWVIFSAFVLAIPSLVAAQATYVGSEKCMSCHKSDYGMWKDTLHNKSQQVLSPSNDTVVVDWAGNVKLKAGNIPEAMVKLSKDANGNYKSTLVDTKDPSKSVTYDISRTYGGWGWKQRYLTKIGNNNYILAYPVEPGYEPLGTVQFAELV